MKDWPIIRVHLTNFTKSGAEPPIYLGPHPTIPRVGDHVGVQYSEHEVWRVEHMLGHDVHADVYLSVKGS